MSKVIFAEVGAEKKTSCVTVLAGFMLLYNVKSIRNTNVVSMSSLLVEILGRMFGLSDLQRKHTISWNAKISVVSASSQKVCSDQCDLQKYIGDSNVSQLKLSLSAVWGIWDYSLSSFTQCENLTAAER